MAKRLGFGPDALIRARPDPKQKWKLPAKYRVRELHAERFGPEPVDRLDDLKPEPLAYDEEAARRYGEQVYWEEYWERSSDSSNSGTRKAARGSAPEKSRVTTNPVYEPRVLSDDDVPLFSDDDVPF